MKQTNWNLNSLLQNNTNQKLFNEAEYDGEYNPSFNKGKEYNPNKKFINIKIIIILLKQILENNQIL